MYPRMEVHVEDATCVVHSSVVKIWTSIKMVG